MSDLTLVGLAAGMGSRFGGPKQLEPLGPGGETMLDFAIHDALNAGFGRVVLIVRAQMREAFEQGVVARWQARVPVELVFQELDLALPPGAPTPERTKPWGTGHALLAVREVVRGPFAVVNADDFYAGQAYQVLADFLRDGSDPKLHAVVGFPLSETMTEAGGVNRGVLRVSADGWLEHVEEVIGIERAADGGGRVPAKDGESERRLPGDTLVSMNMWGFAPTILAQLAEGFHEFHATHGAEPKTEYLLPTKVEELIREGEARVRVLRGAGPWCGVTYPEDRESVRGVLEGLVRGGSYEGFGHR
jgi:hypothetical protein